MAELRVDPLSGLRTVVGDPEAGWDGGGDQPRPDPLGGGHGQPELFARSTGAGALELIDHPRALSEQDADELAATMDRWRERMRAHSDAAYVHLAVDEDGPGPGRARLHALPFVPAQVARERERFSAYRERTQGRNLQADLLQAEVRDRERVVVVGPGAVAVCPFASSAPFHVQLLPRAERERFQDDGPTGADTLHDVLHALVATLAAPPRFGLWVRTAPPGATSFCWRIDLVPRVGPADSLEAGAGVRLTSLSPEDAADRLRDALR